MLFAFNCTILVFSSSVEVPWVVEGLSLYMGEKGLMLFEDKYLFWFRGIEKDLYLTHVVVSPVLDHIFAFYEIPVILSILLSFTYFSLKIMFVGG